MEKILNQKAIESRSPLKPKNPELQENTEAQTQATA